MTSRPFLLMIALGAGCLAVVADRLGAQQATAYQDVDATRKALHDARVEGEIARARAESLEAEAARATAQADRTAREAAAIAARIQQAEAEVGQSDARARLIAREQAVLRARLAERQQPLVRLTAALQRLSRRPPALALLRPGSIQDTMHMRAIFETMLPQIRQRTAALRSEIDRARQLQRRAELAASQLRASEVRLKAQRRQLVALETRQRLDSRAAVGEADREAERALALAEQAQDLGSLVSRLGEAGALREALARLPGPVLRPARPADAQVTAVEASSVPANGPRGYILPVAGRLITGFGTVASGQAPSRGLTLGPRPGAQVVAPGGGRVAFAGPFRGFGRIIIIEHDGEWTTLVTGLSRLDARVGETLVAGSPIGLAPNENPLVTIELRRSSDSVNPLEYIARP